MCMNYGHTGLRIAAFADNSAHGNAKQMPCSKCPGAAVRVCHVVARFFFCLLQCEHVCLFSISLRVFAQVQAFCASAAAGFYQIRIASKAFCCGFACQKSTVPIADFRGERPGGGSSVYPWRFDGSKMFDAFMQDLRRVQSQRWLNDNILDFYFQVLQLRAGTRNREFLFATTAMQSLVLEKPGQWAKAAIRWFRV